MKKITLMVIILLLFLVSIISEKQNFKTAKANWIPLSPKVPSPLPPTILVDSPQNRTYFTDSVQLAFTVDEAVTWTGYRLDDGAVVDCSGNTQIAGLANGSHKLVVYANSTASAGVSETIYFTVQRDTAEPIFSMPQEYINYTITTRNGTIWATVDGNYPLYCANAETLNEVEMLYPTPPGTTNISITLDGTQLTWRNYTEQHPMAYHYTILGDWPMIAITFTPTEFFVLAIHYEHPIIAGNESYQFLYDLNIAPYLSASNPTSTAQFTLKSEINLYGLEVFTVEANGNRRKVEFIIENEEGAQPITFTVISRYCEPLPGDVLITFSMGRTQVEPSPAPTNLTTAVVTTLIGIGGLVVVAWYRKHEVGDKKA